jgi:hypothetical protein
MMAVLSFLVVAVVQGQEPNEAEKLFRAMEKTLTAAKALQVIFEAKLDNLKGEIAVKAKLTAAAGNKMLLKGESSIGGMSHDLELVSDGKLGKGQVFGEKFSGKDTPKGLYQNVLLGGMRRIGIVPALFAGIGGEASEKKEASVEKLYKVSDFKLGDKIKNKGRAAQGVQYRLIVPGSATFKAEVFLDSETNMPLRRTLSSEKDGQKFSLVETYTVQLNPKIDN